MENLVFEKDYSKDYSEIPDRSPYDDIFVQAISGGFLRNYSDALNAVPKVVIPEYKANYEYVLQVCDDLAKSWGGSIRGVVSYEQWEATINVMIPYVEFTSPEELQKLREIAEKSHGVAIQPTDGGIRIHVYNRYFEDCISDDEKTCITYDCIFKDKKLAEMLGLSTELPPELQEFVNYLNQILDAIEKSTGRERTEIFKEFLFRVGNPDEAEDIYETMKNVVQDMINESGAQ